MTERTNLDAAADKILERGTNHVTREQIRFGFDEVHPALADLTPDDVGAIFALVVWSPEGKWVTRD